MVFCIEILHHIPGTKVRERGRKGEEEGEEKGEEEGEDEAAERGGEAKRATECFQKLHLKFSSLLLNKRFPVK